MIILSCHGHAPISKAIQVCSFSLFSSPRWPPSHIAVILKTTPEIYERTGQTHLWVESSTLLPRKCILAKTNVVGLQAHKVSDRWLDYPEGGIQMYKLANPLSESAELMLSHLSTVYWRLEYPPTSGSVMKRLLFRTGNVPLCSEFVKDLMVRAGRSNPTSRKWYSPGRFIREHLRDGSIIPFIGGVS